MFVSCVVPSPNNSGPRAYQVTRITPHCMVGQLSAKKCGDLFARSSYQASSNYGIGTDGEIGLYVDETKRSWCSSNADNDNKAITIECASDTRSPYAMNSKVYGSLVRLCVDICRRYGKNKLDKRDLQSHFAKESTCRTVSSADGVTYPAIFLSEKKWMNWEKKRTSTFGSLPGGKVIGKRTRVRVYCLVQKKIIHTRSICTVQNAARY